MSAPELKNCPFCGGDASAEPHLQHKPGCYFDVLARFKTAPIGDLSMADEVLAAWNRRAQPAEKVQPVVKHTCAARHHTLAEPQDCDWPVCGCDPHATKVIEALQESGALYTRPPAADAYRLRQALIGAREALEMANSVAADACRPGFDDDIAEIDAVLDAIDAALAASKEQS